MSIFNKRFSVKSSQKDQSILKIAVRKAGSLFLDIGTHLRCWALSNPKPILPKQSERIPNKPLALVAGYFSFEDGFATFGDTEAMDITCGWLKKSNIRYDIACHYTNGTVGLSLVDLDPTVYDIFVFVCGPWKEQNNNILDRFDHCLKIGVNLSIENINSNRFDLLYPRDLPNQFNPDIVFSSNYKKSPLLGICLVHPQAEYGDRQRHQRVESAVKKYLNESGIAYINIDTLYRDNKSGITNTKSFENLLMRLDVVISSRLHGMVFSLKNETPVVAIDAIAGGAKLTKQAEALDWPVILDGDTVNDSIIAAAVQVCLQSSIQRKVMSTITDARESIAKVEKNFINDIRASIGN